MERNWTCNKPCALILIALSFGIALDRWLNLPVWAAAIFLFAFTSLAAAAYRLPVLRQKWIVNSILISAWVSLGAVWHHLEYCIYANNDISCWAASDPAPISVRGQVLQRMEGLPAIATQQSADSAVKFTTRLVARVRQIRQGDRWQHVSGKLAITVHAPFSILSGERFECSGMIAKPMEPASRFDFDAPRYFRSQRILAVMYVDQPGNISRREPGNWISRWRRECCRISDHCSRTIEQNYSAESAPYIQAMLLGERHRISARDREKFLLTGTMHLLAISGLHVGILVAGWVVCIRASIGARAAGYALIIFLTLGYCFLAGFKPPVLRATILVVVFCLSRIVGRNPDSINSLGLAGILVLAHSPSSLFQVGPQLSFLAVAVLIVFTTHFQASQPTDSLQRLIRRKRSRIQVFCDQVRDHLRMLVLTSTTIWIVTLPLVVENFHVISIIGLFSNVILMLPIAILLNAAFLSLLFGLFGLGLPFAVIADSVLHFLRWWLDYSSELPFAYCWTFGVGTVWLGIFYGGFIFQVLFTKFRLDLRTQLILATIWLATSLVWIEWERAARQTMRVTFIDVRHGTSILLEFPNGKAVLYDAGSLRSASLATRRISAVLWERKVQRLDTVLISHADLDHFNSLPKLMKRFSVGQVLVTPQMKNKTDSPSVNWLRKSMVECGVPIAAVASESRIGFEERCASRILHPTRLFRGQSDNADSLVLRVEFAGRSILLTGDVEQNGLRELLARSGIEADILQVPHHGSRGIDHKQLAETVGPDWAILSCSKKRLHPEVFESYTGNQAEVLITANSGAIVIEWGPSKTSGIQVRTFRDE